MARSWTRIAACSLVFGAGSVLSVQPTKAGVPGTFEIVGNSGVSAQQLFLGTANKIYILDKTEGNLLQVNGHSAWAVEYDINTNQIRAMDVISNSFCAGGGVMGDGTWVSVGGNQAVITNGDAATAQDGSQGPYMDADGGKAMRFITPCDDQTCQWIDDPSRYMPTRRWYPTIEKLEDGSLMFIGGNQMGGFVNNNASDNNPTYEFYPPRGSGDPIQLNILTQTLPANLFPLTWLLPSGNLFIQTNWKAQIFDYRNNVEYSLPDIPEAVRTYPASAANAMLPLTPANNWTATVLFCGGTDLQPDQWTTTWAVSQYPASASCVMMSPDVSNVWQPHEPLPVGRSMSNFIILPNQKFFLSNGANTGVSGYGFEAWAIGHSYADHPVLTPLMYDPAAPDGSRFSSAGLSDSTVPRMYHSTCTLLPDGSVFVAGSNPNPDYTVGDGVAYPTEYRTERFYPEYYSKHRPEPEGLPTTLGYGGNYFNVTLSAADAPTDTVAGITVVVIRTGFATHAINMGQRLVQLDSTYTIAADGSVTLHVAQMPPNPSIFPPGPALMFVVVNGVPSVGTWIMVGSGKIEVQAVAQPAIMPASSAPAGTTPGNGTPGKSSARMNREVLSSLGLVGLGLAMMVMTMAL